MPQLFIYLFQIYGNLQEDDQPSKLNFNLANNKFWRPFFNKGYVNPGLGSVQTDNPTYLPTDPQYAIDLQDTYVATNRSYLLFLLSVTQDSLCLGLAILSYIFVGVCVCLILCALPNGTVTHRFT